MGACWATCNFLRSSNASWAGPSVEHLGFQNYFNLLVTPILGSLARKFLQAMRGDQKFSRRHGAPSGYAGGQPQVPLH